MGVGWSIRPNGFGIFFTLIASVLAGAAMLGALVAIESGSRVGWAAGVVSPFALAMIVDGIWQDTDDRFKWILSGVALLSACLVACGAQLFAHRELPRFLAAATGLSAAVAAAVSIEGAWVDERFSFTQRGAVATWTLAAVLFLLVPTLEHGLAYDPLREQAQP